MKVAALKDTFERPIYTGRTSALAFPSTSASHIRALRFYRAAAAASRPRPLISQTARARHGMEDPAEPWLAFTPPSASSELMLGP